MMGIIMQIVIIDDGINKGFFRLKPLINDWEIDREQKISIRRNKNELVCSHGTICAAIILNYAPDAEISSIKILDPQDGKGSRGQLVTALQWCLANDIALIHLSIGSTQFADFEEVRILIARLFLKGCTIVAAYHNKNIYTMPASLDCVFGVRCNDIVGIPAYRVKKDRFDYFIEATGKHKLANFYKNEFTSPQSNSYAAPYVTALIHNLLMAQSDIRITNIWKKLSGKTDRPFCRTPDFIDRATVIDFTGSEITEDFYFQVSSIHTAESVEMLGGLDSNTFLIILAKAEDKLTQLMNFLVRNEKRIKGIFYCFSSVRIGPELPGNLCECLWYEGCYLNNYIQADAIIDNIEVPLVYLYGQKKYLVKLLRSLKKMFLTQNYAIKIIGEFGCAYLYGFEYIDSPENRQVIINAIYQQYKPDIILCGIDSRDDFSDNEDLCLSINRDDQAELIYNRIISEFQ